METYVRMTGRSRPIIRLQRSLDKGDLRTALVEAREFAVDGRPLPLDVALGICVLMAEHSDGRFERAAIRWIGRFLAETTGISLEAARVLVDGFDALPDPEAREALERLCVRYRVRG